MLKRLAVLVVLMALRPAPASAAEGCGTYVESPCTYTATEYGGIGGYGATPGAWTVTIVRKTETLTVRSLGGFETYACGVIAPGDKITASSDEGSGVFAGNPGICF